MVGNTSRLALLLRVGLLVNLVACSAALGASVDGDSETDGRTRSIGGAAGGAAREAVLKDAKAGGVLKTSADARQKAVCAVEVKTDPPGLSVVLNGTAYAGSWTGFWITGASHTISCPATAAKSNIRYRFKRWSDGGARTHTVSPTSAATYVAEYEADTITVKGAASLSGEGANVKVDGGQDAGNRTFTQAKASTHVVGAPSPPAAGDGYTNDSRSDGGGQSHTIQPQSDATYAAAHQAAPKTLYVDDDYTPATPGWGDDHFATIQNGIAAAVGGDTVEVAQGTYAENINFWGRAITVRSTNPDDPAVVAATIIDGNQAGSVVTFWSGEGPDSILKGFTIRNGRANQGGGIGCWDSSPTIQANVICDNTATATGDWNWAHGGGIYCWASSSIIRNNVIQGNHVESLGFDSGASGGGICCHDSSPEIRNNVICGNTIAGMGPGSGACGGGVEIGESPPAVFQSNTIAHNSASGDEWTHSGGIHVSNCDLTITNCIVWENLEEWGCQIGYWCANVTINYCNVDMRSEEDEAVDGGGGDAYWGPGNIHLDPRFANPASGDYHLKSQAGRWNPGAGWVTDDVTSPCVDAGDPASDYANEVPPNGDRVNLGAYGNTAQASKSVPDPDITSALPPSGPITTYMKIQGLWFGVAKGTVEVGGADAKILSWTDTEIRCRVEPGTTSGSVVVRRLNGVESDPVPFTVTAPETVYVDDDNTSGIENGTPTRPFSKVQRGVDAAVENDSIRRVIALPGAYVENVDFRGEDITVQSTDPDAPAVVAATIIDGNQGGSTVTFNTGEGADSVLTGFTIRGGSGADHFGGGIHCDGTSPVIEKNRIIGNTVHFHGGGVYCKGGSPTIRNNVIATNVARWFGAGIVSWDSTATISRNTIHDNAAHWYGGGIFVHGPAAPTIKNNVVYGNTGSEGAGIACIYQCSPLIENNTVATNAAERAGGGVYAAWDCSPVLKNMIVWGNSAPGGSQVALAEDSSSEITYSDVQWGEALVHVGPGCTLTWGDGNVNLLPLFASLTDFHLLSTGGRYLPSCGLPPEDPAAWLTDAEHSPCIDTGDSTSVYAEELAPNGSRINMGAYGNTSQASKSGVGAPPLATGRLHGTEDAPHLMATRPALGSGTFGVKKLTLTFDRAIIVGASAVEVYGWQTGAHLDYRLTYDAAEYTLHLEWPLPLPADSYEVRVIADAILSADGSMTLDGEVSDPTDPESLPSGDGTPGGDAYLEFEVE